MKCTKCGFVSFDYLSECKKCGTSLAGTREALGLTAAKPSIPFFLGSLIKDHENLSAVTGSGAGGNTFLSFDFGEDLDSSKFLDENPPSSAAAGGVPSSGGTDTDDFNLLEISDEEIDLLIDEGEESAGPGPAGEAHTQVRMEAGRDIGGKEQTGAAKAAGGLIPEFDVSSLPGLAKTEGPPTQATTAKVPDAAEGEEPLKIDLSDKDLEALLNELEQSAQAKPKKASDPEPGAGSEDAG